MYEADELVGLFNSLFMASCGTELVAGSEEPVYLPAVNAGELHRILFTRDYFSSALHEISHWCVAGHDRRLLVDFGYWYEPDGRTLQQQQDFEVVEVKPQALEWIFSAAAGVKFRVSVDNLNINEYDSSAFTEKVAQQVGLFLTNGLPDRAQQLTQRLIEHYRQKSAFAEFYRLMVLQKEAFENRADSVAQ
jgi:elongation factor P hydroxylase